MKKSFTFLSAILLVAITVLPLVSCGSSSFTTYKVLTHFGYTESNGFDYVSNLGFEDLQLSPGSFTLVSKSSTILKDVMCPTCLTETGTVKIVGDKAICTVTEFVYKNEFPDEQLALDQLKKMKPYMDEHEYNIALDAINGGYKSSPSKEKTSSFASEFVFSLNKNDKTALILSSKTADGSAAEIDYFDDGEPGTIRKVKLTYADGTVEHHIYNKDGKMIEGNYICKQ